MDKIELIRVYDIKSSVPEYSFLVDRLWPRGVTKVRLSGAQWLKDIAPTNALRHWFHEHPEQWSEFEQRYLDELRTSSLWQPLVNLLKEGKPIKLLFASKDIQHNQAIVLRDFLLKQITDNDRKHRQTDE